MTNNGPVFGKDLITLAFDGTFLDKEKKSMSSELPKLPTFVEDGKSIQVILSEYIFQSGIWAFHKIGKF
jgi:hypothetical protein